MATLYLRPTADSSRGHSCSSGSSGYTLINEASADDDSTYIYQSVSSTSNSSATSVFKVSGSVSSKIKISSLQLQVRAKTTKGESKDTAQLYYNLYFNGVEGSSGGSSITTSYANYGKTYNASDFGFGNTVFDSFDATNLVVHVETDGKKNASKNDSFQNRVTQVYLLVTYEEVTDPVYTCAAVAGEGIANATVSQASVVSGNSCTFTASLNSNYDIFSGWYSDSGCTNLVSTANPYTTAITADTTLYTKASRSQFTMTVGSAEHGTASVSSTIVLYGDNATYTFTPEDDTWELYGWYSDSGFSNLVSESNPYTFAVTANTTLYPKVGTKRYTVTLNISNSTTYAPVAVGAILIAVDWEALTEAEKSLLYLEFERPIGLYAQTKVDNWQTVINGISSEKIYATAHNDYILDKDSLGNAVLTSYSCSLRAPLGSVVVVNASDDDSLDSGVLLANNPGVFPCITQDGTRVSDCPKYFYTVTGDATFSATKEYYCEPTLEKDDGIDSVSIYPWRVRNGGAFTVTATAKSGYDFAYYTATVTTTTSTAADDKYYDNPLTYTTTVSSSKQTMTFKAFSVKHMELYVKSGGAYKMVSQAYYKGSSGWVKYSPADIQTILNNNKYVPKSS